MTRIDNPAARCAHTDAAGQRCEEPVVPGLTTCAFHRPFQKLGGPDAPKPETRGPATAEELGLKASMPELHGPGSTDNAPRFSGWLKLHDWYELPDGRATFGFGGAIMHGPKADVDEAAQLIAEAARTRRQAKGEGATAAAGTYLVLNEIRDARVRQMNYEFGRTLADDDTQVLGQLARAAICYASPVPVFIRNPAYVGSNFHFCDPWPWPDDCDDRLRDPTDGGFAHNSSCSNRRELLVDAAALLVAEIERLDRLERTAARTCPDCGLQAAPGERVACDNDDCPMTEDDDDV